MTSATSYTAARTSPMSRTDGVPAGFVRTEIGVFPLDWPLRPLALLVDRNRGVRYGIVQPGKEDPTGRYMIRGQDYAEGWVSPSVVFRVSSAVEERYRNARVLSGDLLITIVGASTGRVAVVPEWLDGANLTQTTARIAVDARTADPRFCMYMLQGSVGERQTVNYIKGGAQPGLNCRDVARFLIPLPRSTAEQQAIAAALSDVDELIGALDKLIDKKRSIKLAAMQQLLTGRTRLPGFSGEWEVKPFSSVLVRLNAKAHQIQTADYQTSGQYPVVDQGKEHVAGFSDKADARFRCPSGGVIVFGDHTCIVKYVDFDFLVGADGTQVLRAVQGQSTRFHAYQLQHRGVEPTGYNRHFKFVKEREFLAPSLEEQTAIVTVLADIDSEIVALEQLRQKAKAIKQGMMQSLLTGRVRLVEPEERP